MQTADPTRRCAAWDEPLPCRCSEMGREKESNIHTVTPSTPPCSHQRTAGKVGIEDEILPSWPSRHIQSDCQRDRPRSKKGKINTKMNIADKKPLLADRKLSKLCPIHRLCTERT